MQATNVDLGKVVFYRPSADQLASATRLAERYNLEVGATDDPDELPRLLVAPSRGLLVLSGFSAPFRAAARTLRAKKGWKRLAIFAVIPDSQIDARILKQYNELQIELLPTSVPENRLWQKLRETHEACRSGKRLFVNNRRAHFRLPLTVKATLLADSETVDISEGGIAFMTNQIYHLGDTGRIDIRSLLGDSEEYHRGFSFEVVSIKGIRTGAFRFSIGARFIDMGEDAKMRLKEAIELIEPTCED